MSMLSAQCVGLRVTANMLDEFGISMGYDTTTSAFIAHDISERMREAADTIESLRDRLQTVGGTCEFVDNGDGEPSPPKCSVCGYDPGIYECAWYEGGTYRYERNYCPNCGCKVLRNTPKYSETSTEAVG